MAKKRRSRSRLGQGPAGDEIAIQSASVTVVPPVQTGALNVKEKWSTLSGTQKLLIGGGIVGLVLLFVFRKPVASAAKKAGKEAVRVVSSGLTAAQLAATKLLMPKGTEYIADLAFELGPKYDVSPYVILGITYAESNFGRALKPQGPGGTGDFIPRAATAERKALVARTKFPATEANGKLTPTQRGWGHGLYQIDLASHEKFIASGKWADPRAAMEYALNLYATNRAQIKKAMPNLGPLDLLYATVASYNAGAGGVIRALKAGVPASKLDKGQRFNSKTNAGTMVTFHEGYVDKILSKSKGLTDGGQNVA